MTEVFGWHRIAGIERPYSADFARRPHANFFALLVMALFEQDRPMTLEEVAARIEEVGVTSRGDAIASLKRCRPAREPVFRDGDRYFLDLRDRSMRHCLWRFGFFEVNQTREGDVGYQGKPPSPLESTPSFPETPSGHVRPKPTELDDAWTGVSFWNWSLRKLVIAVLDAANGPLDPEEIVESISRRTTMHGATTDFSHFHRIGSPLVKGPDGKWGLQSAQDSLVQSTRRAVCDLAAYQSAQRQLAKEREERRQRWEAEKRKREQELLL